MKEFETTVTTASITSKMSSSDLPLDLHETLQKLEDLRKGRVSIAEDDAVT
jgi:hypothetical protein